MDHEVVVAGATALAVNLLLFGAAAIAWAFAFLIVAHAIACLRDL